MSALKVCPQCGTEYPANARFCEIDGTALRSAADNSDLLGTIVADRYHVLKKLGEGGMGQVYLAEHVKMGRKSALKVMHAGMKSDVDAISRFNREAANASRISHPHVAAVYDFGETPEGVIYLAMEFIDGAPLTDVIEAEGALSPARAAEIVRQTAEALSVAHDMGIVHRDLKPDNIMIAKNRDGSDCVKVVDFGIAKAAGNSAQKVTKTGLVVGTPEYMSPEQLAGDKIDGRSDLYSLAIVAFNMLTGKLPFPGETAQESMIMRLTEKPRPLAEMRPEIAWPADVQAVMDRALERDVTKRYQTATEFALALCAAVDRMTDPHAAPAPMAAGAGAPIPPTRVADASAAAGAQAPASIGAAAAVAPSVIPPAKKSNLGLIGVVVAVVVLAGGGVAYKVMSGRSAAAASPIVSPTPANNAAPSDSTASTQQAGTTQPSTPQPSSAAPAASSPASQAASNAPANTPTDNPPAASRQPPTANVVDQLQALLDQSRDPAKGAVVLSTVGKLQLKSSREIYLGAVLRSNVAQAKGDTQGACDALRQVQNQLAPAELDQAKDRMTNALSCPE